MTPSIKLAIAMALAMTPIFVWMGIEAKRQADERAKKNLHTKG